MDAATLPPVSDLYRQHRTRALQIARRILGDSAEAEDVVHDVFSRLCQGPMKFDGKAACSTWLYRVMVNSCINTLRARRRRSRLDHEPQIPLDPEVSATGAELHQQLLACIKELSPQHQQVLMLRELRGLSYPEIASMLGVPEGTVKSALNRARQRLQEAMGSALTELSLAGARFSFDPCP